MSITPRPKLFLEVTTLATSDKLFAACSPDVKRASSPAATVPVTVPTVMVAAGPNPKFVLAVAAEAKSDKFADICAAPVIRASFPTAAVVAVMP